MAERIERSCDDCEWNTATLLSDTWCAKHDLDKLPLYGCGEWRPVPQINSAAVEEGRQNT